MAAFAFDDGMAVHACCKAWTNADDKRCILDGRSRIMLCKNRIDQHIRMIDSLVCKLRINPHRNLPLLQCSFHLLDAVDQNPFDAFHAGGFVVHCL